MQFIKQVFPPFIYDFLRVGPFRRYGWFGNYKNWEQALEESDGYDSKVIAEKVKEATLKVKTGEAVHERDSVLFKRIVYDWPVLSGLLWVASQNRGNLNVIDFGGSMGTTYWQNRRFFQALPSLRWNIIEQERFVERGKELFEDERLKFYLDLESCLKESKPNVVVISGVLQYIKEPYQLLSTIAGFKIDYLIISILPFTTGKQDRLTIQKVPPYIYKASYPAWFFSEEKFLKFIKEHYEMVEEFDCGLKLNLRSSVKGLILKLK